MIEGILRAHIQELFRERFQVELAAQLLSFQRTRREFTGDITLVVFPLTRFSRQDPQVTAQLIGEHIVANVPEVKEFNVVKGFLNILLRDPYWLEQMDQRLHQRLQTQQDVSTRRRIVIEYSSPNTNKPLHLGHIRNNLLGFSLARLLEANGHEVIKVNLVNDRGIHICKSMLAWQKWGEGETPETSGLKGDHLVGKYYVLFDRHFREQAEKMRLEGFTDDQVQQSAPLMQEARGMLRQWEEGEPQVRRLWEKMNGWVYEGFDQTYERLGVDFDKIYYESDTYALGKALVLEGLQKGVFSRRDDGSVWADLSPEGMDEKLLLRSDGTSVYMTQDLGTAQLRYDDFSPDELIYVVGNEQNYHFEVLERLLKMLGRPWSQAIHHFSYGMVELPHGRMKSREGTVVDADDLMQEMEETARRMAEELGKLDDMEGQEAQELYRMISLGALKYFILKVDPKKNMMFNPEESIDFNGNTGPFIQYTYARICSVFRKAGLDMGSVPAYPRDHALQPKERVLLRSALLYPEVLRDAGREYSPALIANYIYELAREFNQFYQEHSILHAEGEPQRKVRLALSLLVARIIRQGMFILGVDVPERM